MRTSTRIVAVRVGWSLIPLLLAAGLAPPAAAQWLQWGGPNRDFLCDVTGLAERWPAEGPPRIWSREIGPGHSAIVVDGDVLYTMCRRGDQDAVLALRTATGETVWETRYDAPPTPEVMLDYGPGPHSTPLIVGDRMYTVGGLCHFQCLDKKTGKILWTHDLATEMGASILGRGYGASPIAYRDTVILNVGGKETSVAAFRQDTGEVVWKSEKLRASYSSAILVRYNDEDHLIGAFAGDRVGLDPATGKTRWKTTVDSQSFGVMATPVWVPPDKLFCSAGYGGGTRLFEIKVTEQGYEPVELWHYRKMQVVHGSMVRIGDCVYASSHGSFGPAFLMAMDLKTGKPLWREREFAKANVLCADGKLLILDERGTLALATATPEKLTVLARADNVLQEFAWTSPTLVGTRLYLRDNHTIMALELGAQEVRP